MVESERVSKNYSGKYRKMVESVRVSKNYPGEYREKVESVQVPGKGRIHESIEKLSGRVLAKGRICMSNDNW